MCPFFDETNDGAVCVVVYVGLSVGFGVLMGDGFVVVDVDEVVAPNRRKRTRARSRVTSVWYFFVFVVIVVFELRVVSVCAWGCFDNDCKDLNRKGAFVFGLCFCFGRLVGWSGISVWI